MIDGIVKDGEIELINWPPSRGADNPHVPKSVEYLLGGITRTDIPREESDLDLTGIRRERTESLKGKFYCNYHVQTVSTLTIEQAHMLLDVQTAEPDSESGHWCMFKPEPIKTRIDYPVNLAVELTIPPLSIKTFWKDGTENIRDYISPGYLMWVVSQEYKRIYEEHEKYGVWGHAITDLFFEGFEIENGLAQLLIGS